MKREDGTIVERTRGTPQGVSSAIPPLLGHELKRDEATENGANDPHATLPSFYLSTSRLPVRG